MENIMGIKVNKKSAFDSSERYVQVIREVKTGEKIEGRRVGGTLENLNRNDFIKTFVDLKVYITHSNRLGLDLKEVYVDLITVSEYEELIEDKENKKTEWGKWL